MAAKQEKAPVFTPFREATGGVVARGGDTLLTEMSDDDLLAMVALDLRRATAEA